MEKGIAIAGNIIVDVVKIINRYPEKNMLANISGLSRAVGGCAPNTLIDLAKIDPALPLKVYGRRGDDEYGNYVAGELARHGIDVAGIKIDPVLPTSYTDVMSECDTGDRTFFHARGANAVFGPDDVDVEKLDCDMFHCGYILLLDAMDASDAEYGTAMARLLSKVQARGIKTSVDVVSDASKDFAAYVLPALKYCDYAFMNETEASLVTGLPARGVEGELCVENIRKTMERLMDAGVREKVVIHAPECGFVLEKGGAFTAVGSLQLPKDYIKGGVGAGDAFTAGALYGIYKGFGNEKLLQFAAAAAACNLAAPDSVSGMLPYDGVMKLNNQYERKVIHVS